MTPKVMVDVTVLPTFSSARSLSMEANLSSSCIPDLSNPSFSHRYGSLYPARKSRLFLEREREREREREIAHLKRRDWFQHRRDWAGTGVLVLSLLDLFWILNIVTRYDRLNTGDRFLVGRMSRVLKDTRSSRVVLVQLLKRQANDSWVLTLKNLTSKACVCSTREREREREQHIIRMIEPKESYRCELIWRRMNAS